VGLLIAVCILVVAAAVVLVVGRPLRNAARHDREAAHADAGVRSEDPHEAPSTAARVVRLDELRAAREAKYREIRDAELDYRTGKLSREDYEAIDRDLRAEALEILTELEQLEADSGS
jgi:flagellar biosynthesis/type III secretory pathway M-ring protein FliF/YscJ